MIGGEYISYEGGSVKVYTGPKMGKFVINKKGKKVYLDRKTIAESLKYIPKKSAKKT
tara:strand:+ start:299 stop:469 length:171 start_codon:yes stop_codon:yes gene_type:complete